MAEYVSRIILEINGQEIDEFKSFEEGEYELREAVKLMNSTGHCNRTPRYSAKVEYVIPLNAAEFDFADVDGGRLTLEYEDGRRITYTGVSTGKIGTTKYDGDKEALRQIDFICEGRLSE